MIRVMNPKTVYWKNLDELKAEIRSSSPRHQEFVEPLPSKRATLMNPADGASRRDFLTLMGFTLGAAACSRGATQHALLAFEVPHHRIVDPHVDIAVVKQEPVGDRL